jgi:hypothetical protein
MDERYIQPLIVWDDHIAQLEARVEKAQDQLEKVFKFLELAGIVLRESLEEQCWEVTRSNIMAVADDIDEVMAVWKQKQKGGE